VKDRFCSRFALISVGFWDLGLGEQFRLDNNGDSNISHDQFIANGMRALHRGEGVWAKGNGFDRKAPGSLW